ncbi:SNF2-related protein [Actinocrispum sp. NPDC049592]|uniref:SNF2-related protein n=1 Tax=Actinocrispum sp. NPDC049592 TaxID=3154835 RepID=UPI003430852A
MALRSRPAGKASNHLKLRWLKDTSLLKVSLRGYQVFGAKFALARKRVIIGDEMGLGKTIEAIAVMASLAVGARRGFPVVCPASVVVNWVNEIARHSALVPHRMHGAGRDGAVGKWLAQGGVGVTTFGTLPKLVLPKRFRPAPPTPWWERRPSAALSHRCTCGVTRRTCWGSCRSCWRWRTGSSSVSRTEVRISTRCARGT